LFYGWRMPWGRPWPPTVWAAPDDNPYSEAQFKTLKYRPDFPARFGTLEDARTHCQAFFAWYNAQHRHSSIGFMTPYRVHYGHAPALRAGRQAALDAAFEAHPERFKGQRPQPPELPTAVNAEGNPARDTALQTQLMTPSDARSLTRSGTGRTIPNRSSCMTLTTCGGGHRERHSALPASASARDRHRAWHTRVVTARRVAAVPRCRRGDRASGRGGRTGRAFPADRQRAYAISSPLT
jgi:hypothetical protein